MHDAFAILQLPRRPWLEESDVRAAFQKAATHAHPDAAGSTLDFANLTQAYQTLREPASRIKHLLALEAPNTPPASGIPAELIPLFPMIAKVREAIDRWNQKRSQAVSKLEQAVAKTELAQLRSDAGKVHDQVAIAMRSALDELRVLDAAWPSHAAVHELAALQARLTFLEKWQAQLRETLLRLDIGPA